MTFFYPETVKHVEKSSWERGDKAWSESSIRNPVQDDTLNQAIIAESGVKPGNHVLDIASGTGNPAVSAALLLRDSGSITLTDLSRGKLEISQIRASSFNRKKLNYCCADMTNLPFADETFDVAMCRFGIMFVKNKVKAAREAMRVLKFGSNITYMVWDAYHKNPPFFIPSKVISEFFGEKEAAIPARHSMCAPGLLKSVMEQAGYTNISERQIKYKNRVINLKRYIANGLKRSHKDRIKGLTKSDLTKLKKLIFQAWSPYENNGATEIPNCARICTGSKPAST